MIREKLVEEEFARELNDFYNSRYEKIYSTLQNVSKEYEKNNNFIINTFKMLRSSIPDKEVLNKINQMNSVKNKMEIISNDFFYKNGLKDGINIITHIISK